MTSAEENLVRHGQQLEAEMTKNMFGCPLYHGRAKRDNTKTTVHLVKVVYLPLGGCLLTKARHRLGRRIAGANNRAAGGGR